MALYSEYDICNLDRNQPLFLVQAVRDPEYFLLVPTIYSYNLRTMYYQKTHPISTGPLGMKMVTLVFYQGLPEKYTSISKIYEDFFKTIPTSKRLFRITSLSSWRASDSPKDVKCLVDRTERLIRSPIAS